MSKITKRLVDTITAPEDKEQIFIRDSLLKGFALRVTQNGVKSFIVEKNLGGKVRRMTIGRYGPFTVEMARKEANKLLSKMASGIDPVIEKQAEKSKKVTLEQAFQDYLKVRKTLTKKTLYDYNRILEIAFFDWKKKTLLSITKDNVAKRHEHLAETRGKAYANLAMRVLRAIFNFSAGQYEDMNGHSYILENPVKRLSHTRAWYRIERRQSYIRPYELANWYKAVNHLSNSTFKDYFLCILFTGLRRQECAKLRWQDVDLRARTLTINDTKNHEKHVLPLSEYLFSLFNRRKTEQISEFVFSGTGSTGYIVEPRKQINKVIDESGVHFTIHDLRRTFITVAEGLDISAYALKRLLNHKMTQDVTSGYIVTDVERLRKPMQQISDFFIFNMKIVF